VRESSPGLACEETDSLDDILLADERLGRHAGRHGCGLGRLDDAVDDQEGDVDAGLAELLGVFTKTRAVERVVPWGYL
jgi:hypothetical protein